MGDTMSHFRQILSGINPAPLLDQIHCHEELWNTDDSWTRGKPNSPIMAASNIVLRYNRTPPNTQQGFGWNRPTFHILDEAIPIIFDLMRAIPGEYLGKVMISRLLPGEKIDWHIDKLPPNFRQYFHRFQIPLNVAEGVRFVVEDETMYMPPGTAWWFNNQRMHAVFNDSDQPRISMFADISPFPLDSWSP
jgi:Aspartyl/Asparaginyl beta-hydroxylase